MIQESSEIIDFFPSSTRLDLNGHYFTWMGINLVPFIDANRIRHAVKKLEEKFNKEEKERFQEGKVLVFINPKENLINNFLLNTEETVYIDKANFIGFYKCNTYLT